MVLCWWRSLFVLLTISVSRMLWCCQWFGSFYIILWVVTNAYLTHHSYHISDIAPNESSLIAFLSHFIWLSSKRVAGTSDLTDGYCTWWLIHDYRDNIHFHPRIIGEEFGYCCLKLWLLAFLVLIFLVRALCILALGLSTADFIPVRFDGFINPFVERVLANIQLAMIIIDAFVVTYLGLAVILCTNLICLTDIRYVQWWQLAGNVL